LSSAQETRSADGENRIENLTFARFLSTPENDPALLAVRNLAASVSSGRYRRAMNPLYVHGPAGVGKTHLMAALVSEATRQAPQLIVTIWQAGDLEGMAAAQENTAEATDGLLAAKQSDLLIVEDVQRVSRQSRSEQRVSEMLLKIFDYLHARQRQLVFTATVGPRQLGDLPARLVSRLGGGLVVGIRPLQFASRLALLQYKAQGRQLAVSSDVLTWLAEHLSGGRQMDGVLGQLETLARLRQRPLDVATLANDFRELLEANPRTIERIAQQVSRYFRIEPRHLQSRRRYQNVLLPRQIGMYLARQLTDLSLEEIGSYFGGRDHSTVLHACRKIQDALAQDVAVSGAVTQLQGELV
jgi:chromosomal replication initiator protein